MYLNAPEFLEGLDEFIENSDINLEEEANNDKINQEEIDEDWDPKLAVEAYL
ncbi:9091_t:CDS:2 [Funneliformis mosseae]|uniref:9091_t:CDS:1 n=1 Tax=Funneliformis mosseae TaxID=27381 RepID=A0A9N9ATX8_FUNMO|nr:9091_t:CDS:2 [Funneliformis mosseae]